MRTPKVQCLLIGKKSPLFTDLVKVLRTLNFSFQLQQVSRNKKPVIKALKHMKSASIVFVSDEASFPLALLSDLIWQYNPDALVVIVTQKTASISPSRPFNDTQFSKLYVKKNSKATQSFLLNLVQISKIKEEFRRCKRLLSVSETRCLWLVDSSREAIGYVSRDLHLYANPAYLRLFGVDSLHLLRPISIKDLILDDEAEIFDGFLSFQMKHQNLSQTLLLSMRHKNGATFRVNIHAILSTFKGRQCWQLWIHKLNSHEDIMETNLKKNNRVSKKNLAASNPFLTSAKKHAKKKAVNVDDILSGIIQRREVNISAQKLIKLNKKYDFKNYYIASLQVPAAQRVGVNDLLFKSSSIEWKSQRQIFWDKVKVTRLIQILVKKSNINFNIMITLSEASVCDQGFTQWLLHILKRVNLKNLTIMVPSQLSLDARVDFVDFIHQLKKMNCQIALNDFSTRSDSLNMLRHIKPDYVRLSLPWMRDIDANNQNEAALGRVIRQLESKNIHVIAPCGYSMGMRKVFVFSGASFCQERGTKLA